VTQPFRLPNAGHVDRDVEVAFTFDGRRYTGYLGDTLASALLANGVRVVGRSFKYHRPRGIVAAGAEEPNALVRLGTGRHAIPNVKATEVPLYAGLSATSQRGWPSARTDAGAAIDRASRFLPPGFYYKTFIRPRRLWPAYEHVLRRMSSSARAPDGSDPDVHERRNVHVDVLVVGAGPAGLTAALAAARSGARVLLIDDQAEVGGSLLDHEAAIDGAAARSWVAAVRRELDAAPETTVLTRASVFARYGHGRFGATQYLDVGLGRQRHWAIRARQTVVATGALERPMVFSNNDRPGVMLASAVQRYLRRYGVVPGRRVLVATNNDTGYAVARDLQAAGVALRAIVDVRPDPPGADLIDGVHVATRAQVTDVRGTRGVEGVEVARGDDRRNVACDLVCVAGGWSPLLSLHAQGGALPAYDPTWGAFVPGVEPDDDVRCVGAANGTQGLAAILRGAAEAGAAAADEAGASTAVPEGSDGATAVGPRSVPEATDDPFLSVDVAPVPLVVGAGKAFVDLQTDVHVKDIEVALAEGYESVEHVKRYTTLGMGTDQGRTGNVNAMHVIAHLRGRPVEEVGTTTFRPPYTPVTLGALAAGATGPDLTPTRYSPLHDRHEDHGAVFMDSGLWRRPRYYAHHGDDAVAAAILEARNVRERVGIADVSTLGKIALRGSDVATFLDRVYVNRWLQLPIGRVRFGVMLRDDGYVFDDGTTARLDDDRFLMTTTTGNAAAVLAHLEFLHQQVWPDLDVAMSSVTDQYAVVALAGPRSRDVLQALLPDEDVGDAAIPFMAVREVDLYGVPLRISRISFSGELAYELAVPADAGEALWVSLLEIGAPVGLRPYGLEAMDYLRIEKGHLVVGADIDGRVSPYDIGIGAMCKTDRDFIGRRSLDKSVFRDPDRPRLAGFVSADGHTMIAVGAQLVASPFDGTPQPSLGRITSRAYSPALDRPIALGLITGGVDAHPGNVYAVSPITGEGAVVEVVDPHLYDPDGSRMRG
jgi:sarcosine oxidase, subunit alpha